MKRKLLTDKDGEAYELTDEFFANAQPARELMTPEQWAMIEEHMAQRRRGQRGPGKKPAKEHITLRLDADIAAHYRDLGRFWQKKINDDLRRAAKL